MTQSHSVVTVRCDRRAPSFVILDKINVRGRWSSDRGSWSTAPLRSVCITAETWAWESEAFGVLVQMTERRIGTAPTHQSIFPLGSINGFSIGGPFPSWTHEDRSLQMLQRKGFKCAFRSVSPFDHFPRKRADQVPSGVNVGGLLGDELCLSLY